MNTIIELLNLIEWLQDTDEYNDITAQLTDIYDKLIIEIQSYESKPS